MIQAFGGNNQSGPIDVATARNACASASGRKDFESETFLVQPTHTLRGEGFDASEDGTGRGTPLVPMLAGALCKDTYSGGMGGRPESAAAGHVLPVSFPANLSGTQCAATENLSPALGAANPTAVAYAIQAGALRTNPASGPDGVGVQADHAYTLEARAEVQAVAFQDRFRGDDGRGYDRPPPVSIEQIGTIETVKPWNVAAGMAVRRLTPAECEKLQGFPVGYTSIPWRKKPASECPDGPRYKALGNSWAVPVAAWIGRRIEAVEAVQRQAKEAANSPTFKKVASC